MEHGVWQVAGRLLVWLPPVLIVVLGVMVTLKQRRGEKVLFLADRMRISDFNLLESMEEREIPSFKDLAGLLKQNVPMEELRYASILSWHSMGPVAGRMRILLKTDDAERTTISILKTRRNLAQIRKYLPEKETAAKRERLSGKALLLMIGFPALVVALLVCVFLAMNGIIPGSMVGAVVLLLCGALFSVVGVFRVYNEWWLRANGKEAVGVIVKMKRRDASGGTGAAGASGENMAYFPVVEYSAGGEKVCAQCSTSVSNRKFKKGQEVQVLYDPKDPRYYRIKGTDGNFMWILFVIMGFAALGVGIFLLAAQ